ncbi:ParB N-terminal domain-containing protein [Maricaulis sp. MIT060901]|uniref:DNA methyltransferase n=1 Tax=Maricaulis sp. MIT060901 TaxID=3096993 RepID=UPI00399A2F71
MGKSESGAVDALKVEAWALDKIKAYPGNPRVIPDEAVLGVARSIEQFGWRQPIVVDKDGVIIVGHTRLKAAHHLGLTTAPVHVADMPKEQAQAYRLADNKTGEATSWDLPALNIELAGLGDLGFDLAVIGFDPAGGELSPVTAPTPLDNHAQGALSDSFGVPPFSVLSARGGWWRERKEQWLALGIQSELGREGAFDALGSLASAQKGVSGDTAWASTSIFDPVLCELIYRWFCPPGGVVLDPFAGGSVRGLVASRLGRAYTGIELRPEQVAANRAQIGICGEPRPQWIEGDSRNIPTLAADVDADLIFSCPPYADLEVYSDDPKDLSTMDYPDFRDAYRDIISKAAARLKENRFACFVVGEVRDAGGGYSGLVQDTIQAFCDAGLSYYNEAVIVTPIGTLAMRARRPFEASRKLGKSHQNMLVFCKGDPRKAAEVIGDVEFGEADAGL